VIHVDNCPAHKSTASGNWEEKHAMVSMLHPPYSPSFAPSDSYLVPMVKRKLESIHAVDDSDPSERLQEVLKDIAHAQLSRGFQT
jgi:hypothetical protein